ncbi:MAG: ATPase [Muribaculaceae bacterium]|nr:ATPase [Muribaculaceae bacterium]
MILIADSGGTSTSWALIDSEEVSLVDTCGFNALHSPKGLLRDSLLATPLPSVSPSGIWFYGAGCATPAAIKRVYRELEDCFPDSEIHVESDMLGAAHALCGSDPGIACILGTGSNSCLYDGEKIVANTPPLGFIIGDEGSGAALGKRFLGLLLKGHMPPEISEAFHQRYPRMDTAEIIGRVYSSAAPNAFLASMCLFIGSCISHPAMSDLVVEEFRRFFRLNVSPYDGCRTLPVHFVGSIASHFQELLSRAALEEGYTLGRILTSPLSALIDYHDRKG